VGLLHDFDYERYPTRRSTPSAAGRSWPSAATPPRSSGHPHPQSSQWANLRPESSLEKALLACDELCGFITAVTLVRPSKSLAEVTAESVVKKMKDKAFARQVNRDEIRQGAEAFGVDLKEHISFVIAAMQTRAAELGLDGSAAGPAGPAGA